MYQALYRKYRPRSFDEVVGQGHITDTLKAQVAGGRLGHAYLFIGTRGTGKTTCAKILARAVNCENPQNGNPCNQCGSCLGIENGSILDVVELDAASNNGVDNVRALRDEAVFSPASVKMRVYIIDEAHMLSTAAFNALLKILEEPPSHLMFILATTELHKVPATILSRCQRHSFKRLTGQTVSKQLEFVAKSEGLKLTADAAELLGRLADGSMRDGLTLLDQCSGHESIDSETILQSIGLAGSHRTAALLEAIAARDSNEAMMIFRALWQDGKDPATLLDELCGLYRDVLMTVVAPKGGLDLLSGAFDLKTLNNLSARISAAELMQGVEFLRKTIGGMRGTPSPRTAAELCILELCAAAQSAPAAQSKSAAAPVREPAAAPVSAPIPALREDEPPEEDFPPWEEPPDRELPAQEPPDRELPVQELPVREAPVQEAPSREAPAEAAEQGTGIDSASLWADILTAIKGKLPAGQYALVSDSVHGTGTLEGDTLVIKAASSFAKSIFSGAEVSGVIRTAAGEILGRPVPVRISNGDNRPKPGESKLDSLAQFGSFIKYE